MRKWIGQPEQELEQEKEAARSLDREADLGLGGSTAQLCSPSMLSAGKGSHCLEPMSNSQQDWGQKSESPEQGTDMWRGWVWVLEGKGE